MNGSYCAFTSTSHRISDSSALARSQTGHAKMNLFIQGYNLYEIIIHWRNQEFAEITQIAKRLWIFIVTKQNKKRFKEDLKKVKRSEKSLEKDKSIG